MKEYKIKINGGDDFVIVFPSVAASLIAKARENGVKEFVVGIEDIMPERMREYLLRVINTNRYTSSQFRFSQILEDPITKEGLYRILQEQLVDMEMDGELCFQKIELIEMMSGESGLEMEGTKPFIWACRDSASSFLYTLEDGSQEKLVIEF